MLPNFEFVARKPASSADTADNKLFRTDLRGTRAPVILARMSTVQEIERAITVLPRRDVEDLRDWIENYLEDELAVRDDFAAKVQRAESDLAVGKGQPHRRPATA